MEDQFANLNEKDKSQIRKAPAMVSLLAAITDGEMDNQERKDAISLSHLRTFTAPTNLRDYYKSVEKEFDKDLDELILTYKPFKADQKTELTNELDRILKLTSKLDKNFAIELRESLNSYAKHVSRSHRNFVYSSLFPVDVPGLSEL